MGGITPGSPPPSDTLTGSEKAVALAAQQQQAESAATQQNAQLPASHPYWSSSAGQSQLQQIQASQPTGPTGGPSGTAQAAISEGTARQQQAGAVGAAMVSQAPPGTMPTGPAYGSYEWGKRLEQEFSQYPQYVGRMSYYSALAGQAGYAGVLYPSQVEYLKSRGIIRETPTTISPQTGNIDLQGEQWRGRFGGSQVMQEWATKSAPAPGMTENPYRFTEAGRGLPTIETMVRYGWDPATAAREHQLWMQSDWFHPGLARTGEIWYGMTRSGGFIIETGHGQLSGSASQVYKIPSVSVSDLPTAQPATAVTITPASEYKPQPSPSPSAGAPGVYAVSVGQAVRAPQGTFEITYSQQPAREYWHERYAGVLGESGVTSDRPLTYGAGMAGLRLSETAQTAYPGPRTGLVGEVLMGGWNVWAQIPGMFGAGIMGGEILARQVVAGKDVVKPLAGATAVTLLDVGVGAIEHPVGTAAGIISAVGVPWGIGKGIGLLSSGGSVSPEPIGAYRPEPIRPTTVYDAPADRAQIFNPGTDRPFTAVYDAANIGRIAEVGGVRSINVEGIRPAWAEMYSSSTSPQPYFSIYDAPITKAGLYGRGATEPLLTGYFETPRIAEVFAPGGRLPFETAYDVTGTRPQVGTIGGGVRPTITRPSPFVMVFDLFAGGETVSRPTSPAPSGGVILSTPQERLPIYSNVALPKTPVVETSVVNINRGYPFTLVGGLTSMKQTTWITDIGLTAAAAAAVGRMVDPVIGAMQATRRGERSQGVSQVISQGVSSSQAFSLVDLAATKDMQKQKERRDELPLMGALPGMGLASEGALLTVVTTVPIVTQTPLNPKIPGPPDIPRWFKLPEGQSGTDNLFRGRQGRRFTEFSRIGLDIAQFGTSHVPELRGRKKAKNFDPFNLFGQEPKKKTRKHRKGRK